MDLIKQRIKRVMAALPQESTSINIMRHILKVVREEYETGSKVLRSSFFVVILSVFVTENFRAKLKFNHYISWCWLKLMRL